MSLVDLIYWAISIFLLGMLTAIGIKFISVLPFLIGRR